MERLKKISADTVFVIQVLLLFILLFESRIEVPAILQAFGRLHPLLLHLPIGLLLVTVVLLFTRRYFEGRAMDELVQLMLHFTALTASFTSLMGLLLSLEGTFGADQLWLHKWLGIALSFLCWGLVMVKGNARVLKPLGVSGVVLLILTGHYGANLTHGENFVLAPLEEDEVRVTRVITDSTALFTATVEPILESKCFGCHNRKKAKGDLILTSLKTMQEGGKSGALWEPSDAANSLIVERLLLPPDHDDHMPPKDKAQLTEDEIRFISLWIDAGADTQKKIIEYDPADTLMRVASAIIPRYEQRDEDQQQYTFRFATPDKIASLSRPNRTVFQIASNEPAVQADFFLRESFDPKHVQELVEVREQLISLNLSKMPVTDEDLGTLTRFANLEVLNLNNTEIVGTSFAGLATLPRLRSLSVSGTRVTPQALRDIASCPSLEEVFVWNTAVSAEDLEALQGEFPGIRWDSGYEPDEKEILKLNAPLLKNKGHVLNRGDKVILKHNLPGTVVRYSLDGTDPDSIISPVYTDPFSVGDFSVVKTRAYKDGWLTSDVTAFILFRKGFRPDGAQLVSAPDERYPGEGVETLIDGNKGLPDYYRHPAWMGFLKTDLVADFIFEKEVPTIKNVTLSYAMNNYAICMTPAEMQLWGGDNPDDLRLIAKMNPPQSEYEGRPRIEGVSMEVPSSSFRYYRFVARPVKKLKQGNKSKRDVWLMVDEVFFN